ncbi:MAG: hypothetical protein V4611_03640 [Patescibacteria group bacterium]
MTERNFDSTLPEVSDDDIVYAFTESLLGTPEHNQWQHFAQQQPLLAREVLLRVQQSISVESADAITLHKIIIDNAAFVVSSLEHAIKRVQSTSDGGDAATQQHASEPAGG